MRGREWVALALCLPALLGVDVLRATNRDVEQGNAKFKAGESEEALKLYDKALSSGVSDAQARAAMEFNRGVALSALQQHDQAAAAFLEATKSKDTSLRARAFYNLGNTFFKGEKFGEAVEAYKRSLVMDPGNADAKWNLELALRRKRDQEEQQQNQDKQNQDEQNQDKQNQDKQNDPNQQQQSDSQKQQQDQNKDQQKDEQDPSQQKDAQQGQREGQQDPNQQENQPGDQAPPERDQGGAPPPGEDSAQEPKPEANARDQDKAEAKPQPAPESQEGQAGRDPVTPAPDMREINAILDSLERSPHEIEQQRARMRALRRRPPVKDW